MQMVLNRYMIIYEQHFFTKCYDLYMQIGSSLAHCSWLEQLIDNTDLNAIMKMLCESHLWIFSYRCLTYSFVDIRMWPTTLFLNWRYCACLASVCIQRLIIFSSGHLMRSQMLPSFLVSQFGAHFVGTMR